RSSAESGAGAAIGLAVLGASLLLGLGFAVDRGLQTESDERATLASFAIEIGQYLPKLMRLPRPVPAPRTVPDISELQGLLPRTTFAIVVTLTAGTLGVLLVARWVATNQRAVNDIANRMLEAPRVTATAAPITEPA